MEIVEETPIAAKGGKKKNSFKLFHAVHAIMTGRHAAIDAGAPRYVWYRPCPAKLKVRVSPDPHTTFSYWRCDPNGDVTLVRGSDQDSPRAWDLPTIPLSIRLMEKLYFRGFVAQATNDPRWILVFEACKAADMAHHHGWTDEGREKIRLARVTIKELAREPT